MTTYEASQWVFIVAMAVMVVISAMVLIAHLFRSTK